MDYCYRCYRCGKIVYEYNIAYGSHGCRGCGSNKLEPIIESLTKFGKWYCKNRNKVGMWYYEKVAVKFNKETPE